MEAYIPKWISVGPYHHNAAHLSSDMYAQKERAVLRMIKRPSPEERITAFDQIPKNVKESELEIRNSYEKNIECDVERLAFMMVLDGCFVLEILRCLSDKTANDDPFFNRHNIEYACYSLLTDMLLLENQLPLFVLIELLKLLMGSDTDSAKGKLSDMLIRDREVGRLFYPFILKERELDLLIRGEAAHLLDLAFHLARGTTKDGTTGGSEVEQNTIPTATELYEAGIKFEACEGGLMTVCFSDNNSTLQLPKIIVTASDGIFLRNLIAYEICKSPDNRIISNFAILMDELINTERDVALLRGEGIIHSYTLGTDKDVASFFNDLRKGTAGAGSSSTDTFRNQRKQLLRCYHSKYRVMFAEFVKLHFSKPWRTSSVVAAVVLLMLTLLQTIYTIK